MKDGFVKEVFDAAKDEEAVAGYPWSAVSLYLRLFPGSGFNTYSSGVTHAVQTLCRRKLVVRVKRGLFRVNHSVQTVR